jgi:uracil-DNA glycosylase
MPDLVQMRTALAQTLENYQRCGLVRFAKIQVHSLPPEILAHLSPDTPWPVTTSHSPSHITSPASQQASPLWSPPVTATNRNQPAPTATVAGTPHSATVVPQPPAPNVVDRQTPATPWTLPVLSIGERETRLSALKSDVQACRKCTDIVCYRQQTVFGTGPLTPTVVFMGEAPGADEDKQGVPFVGKAGQLLTKIIEAMQLKREEVFILNALKCRPPQNRTPVPEEIEQCRPFVETQLEVLQPKYIVCLGAVAVRSLLNLTQPVGGLRGRFHQYRQARVVVTYHPSYLLRNESAKKLVWQDMQMLMRELGLKPPEKKA